MSTEPDRITAVSQVTTYVPDGLGQLPVQFPLTVPPVAPATQPAPSVLAALLTSWLTECQAVETALWAVLSETLDTAVGVGLDTLGAILGLPRNGLDDDTYRLQLRVQILVLKSNGHPDDVQAVVRQSLQQNPGATFTYTENSLAVPLVATAYIEVQTGPGVAKITDAQAAQIEAFLRRAKAVGTRVLLAYSTTDVADTFTFSDDLTSPADTHRGWGDSSDPTVGGIFTSVLD